MGKEINVLSIDFDFFQKVTSDTLLRYYPDGLDLPTVLTEITWSRRYDIPDNGEALRKVEVDLGLLRDVKILVNLNRKRGCKLMITNSHKHAYNFIGNEIQYKEYESLHIYNLDLHHDYFNNCSEVDCGNWLGHAVKDFPNCTATWVMNPVSLDESLVDPLDVKTELKELHKVKTLRTLKNKKFDLIFLCRSDSWTPLHLDEEFKNLFNYCLTCVGTGTVENGVREPRKYVRLGR